MSRKAPAIRPAHDAGGAMKCKCNDQRHDLGTAVWHRAFCAWYDHERAGNQVRARAWGWFADRMARFA